MTGGKTGPEDQFKLGCRHEEGKEAQEDFREAFKYFKLAADGGHAEAQNKVGHFYELGIGVHEDSEESIRYYKLAAEQRSLSTTTNTKS